MVGALPRNGGNKTTSRIGPTVSRRLRAEGVNVSSSARKYRHDGTFVSARADHVSVLIDLGDEASNVATTARVLCKVSHWKQASGLSVSHCADGARIVWFSYGV